MTPELQQKISKLYEMVKRGTPAEQDNAKRLMDKILAKHNLEADNIDFESLTKEAYRYTYSTELDMRLILRLVHVMVDDEVELVKHPWKPKFIQARLKYMDNITITCAYEYFRRHMKKQWEAFCAPELAKCRKAKTRNKRREELKDLFFQKYCIESKLYHESELQQLDPTKLSRREMRDRMGLRGVEGGQYNRQVTNGLMIEN